MKSEATQLMSDLNLVIWDWNGTLHDDAGICRELTNRQLRKLGLEPLSDEAHQVLFKHPVSEYYRSMGARLSGEEFAALAEDFHKEFEVRRREGQLRGGAREIIEQFELKNVDQIILSAYREKDLREMLTESGIQNYFIDILGPSDCYAVEKITRAIAWFGEHNYSRNKTLLVGDTNHDFEVAQALGVRCVLIPGGYQHVNLLRQTGAEVLSSLEDLAERIR